MWAEAWEFETVLQAGDDDHGTSGVDDFGEGKGGGEHGGSICWEGRVLKESSKSKVGSPRSKVWEIPGRGGEEKC